MLAHGKVNEVVVYPEISLRTTTTTLKLIRQNNLVRSSSAPLFFARRTTTSIRKRIKSQNVKKRRNRLSKILDLNHSLILVGPVIEFGIEVRIGENHPRIWIIKNYP
jgi:hypothetical protein